MHDLRLNGFAALTPPTHCCHCGEPFKVEGNHVTAWRANNGQLYCTEFCADSDEEVSYAKQRRYHDAT